jgi:uncharacterized protein DUF4157
MRSFTRKAAKTVPASNAEPQGTARATRPVQTAAVQPIARHDIRHVPIAGAAEGPGRRPDPGYMAPTAIHRRPDARPASQSYGPPLQAYPRPGARLGSGPAAYDGDAFTMPVPNRTGMPDRLKAGFEALSGQPMDDVRVYRNSARPAALNARAFAQGRDIHLGPGHEKHLPHEAWHVVQQAQGRVQPTLQAKGVVFNDDEALEREATAMGAKVMASGAPAGGQEPEAGPAVSLKPEADNTTARSDSRGVLRMETASPAKLEAAFPRTDSSHAPVQRVVLSKVYELKGGGFKKTYYSTNDGKTEFKTKAEAREYDAKLAKQKASTHDPYGRVPTNVTYHRTPARNVVPASGDAGPHSLSHSSLTNRLKKRIEGASSEKLIKLRDRQIPAPEKFKKEFDAEKPTTIGPAAEKRALTDYKISYQRLEELLDEGENNSEVAELFNRLIQADPYTAYGKGKTTGKLHIKNKNERADDSFDVAFDTGASFRHPEGFEKYKKKRKEIYSSEEEFAFSEDEGRSRRKKKEESASDQEASSSEDERSEKKKRKIESASDNEDSPSEGSDVEEQDKEEEKKTKKQKKSD